MVILVALFRRLLSNPSSTVNKERKMHSPAPFSPTQKPYLTNQKANSLHLVRSYNLICAVLLFQKNSNQNFSQLVFKFFPGNHFQIFCLLINFCSTVLERNRFVLLTRPNKTVGEYSKLHFLFWEKAPVLRFIRFETFLKLYSCYGN